MYLNQRKDWVTLNELSEHLKISKNNLIKVSNQLAKLDFIETTRGRTGGLIIKEDTGRKTLREIVTQTEETFHMVKCFAEKKSDCTFLPQCHLQKSLSNALNAFLKALDQQTLNDVTPKKALRATSHSNKESETDR